jgi:hypothetical protein
MQLQLLGALLTVNAKVTSFTAPRYVAAVFIYTIHRYLNCFNERGVPRNRAADLSECHQLLVSCAAANKPAHSELRA